MDGSTKSSLTRTNLSQSFSAQRRVGPIERSCLYRHVGSPHPDGEDVWQAGELVPAVDVEGMKAMWAVMQDVKRHHPEGNVAPGAGVFQGVCRPNADIRAVGYRLGMLGLVEHLLEAAYPGGQFSDAALRAAAKVEMTWLPVGVQPKDFPFGLIEFLAQARAEA